MVLGGKADDATFVNGDSCDTDGGCTIIKNIHVNGHSLTGVKVDLIAAERRKKLDFLTNEVAYHETDIR